MSDRWQKYQPVLDGPSALAIGSRTFPMQSLSSYGIEVRPHIADVVFGQTESSQPPRHVNNVWNSQGVSSGRGTVTYHGYNDPYTREHVVSKQFCQQSQIGEFASNPEVTRFLRDEPESQRQVRCYLNTKPVPSNLELLHPSRPMEEVQVHVLCTRNPREEPILVTANVSNISDGPE